MLRDDMLAYMSGKKDRRKVLKEILALEEQELGVSRLEPPEEARRRAEDQRSYAERMAQPFRAPENVFGDYLRAPRTLRGKGNRSLDVLFHPNLDGTFWLYGSSKVSVTTLGALGAYTSGRASIMAGGTPSRERRGDGASDDGGSSGRVRTGGSVAARDASKGHGGDTSTTFLTQPPGDTMISKQTTRRPTSSGSAAAGRSGGGRLHTSVSFADGGREMASPSPIRRPHSSQGNDGPHHQVARSASFVSSSSSALPSRGGAASTGVEAPAPLLPSRDEVRRSPIGQQIKKQLDALMNIAATKERCGLIFDLISTSKLIATGVPHEIGAFIYDYIEDAHFEKVGLKFVFVGITDNANCCAARDVFCRDDMVSGKYVGDTKRPFDALDNVHMYTVFPGHRLHPFSRGVPHFSANTSTTAIPTSGTYDPISSNSSSSKPL